MNAKLVTKVGTVAGIMAFGAMGVMPALADNSVSQEVTCTNPARTASIANQTLTAVEFSQTSQDQTGTLTLSAADTTCTGLGWNVTVSSSALAYSGSGSGSSIPAANLVLGTPNTPTGTSGQAVDATGGPKVVGTGGALSSAREVIDANANYGMGAYSQTVPVTLTIPARSVVGTYTATLTVTISSGPGA
ncbi:MAG: WxL domain-containing protein [Thermomicrobiales bacterium]